VKISSAKSKGRRAQQQAAEMLVAKFPDILEPDDIRSTAMGVTGADLQMSPLARRMYPFDVEVKNVEKLNIWDAINQARNHGTQRPMVCFSRNNEEMFVAIRLEDFLHFFHNKDFVK
jgi:hypothetical protein